MASELVTYVPVEELSDVPPPLPARPRCCCWPPFWPRRPSPWLRRRVRIYLAARSDAVAADGALLRDGVTIPFRR